VNLLRVVDAGKVPTVRRSAIDAHTLITASKIVEDVRTRGIDAVREHAERLGDLTTDQAMIVERSQMRAALDRVDREARRVLEQAADRIYQFAMAQRGALKDLDISVPGGRGGHWVAPVERAGCYAPGGRFPLPSSALMTAMTARAAGVSQIWLASPRPADVTLAAGAIAGVDGLLAIGGAQAIAALAFGAGDVPASDAVVGPGNRWVTAAKQLVSGQVAIDMLAGPSELLVIADESADPRTIAADLLAQAEHDTDAGVVLITSHAPLLDAVQQELTTQLATLPTAATARGALANSYAVVVGSIDEAIEQSDRYAPEHLQILTRDALTVARRCAHYGGIFIGERTAEVFGDYGLGPNHTLPTGGTARSFAGLSVFTFLRIRTWLHTDAPEQAITRDVASLARLEGLEAHARSAEQRL
jgi:phosphoribosyl-ATP pyrophosphohydrolase/phosphoribosyl-AMP cyclohydrolase/histidinol dehydrogenase